MEIDQRKRTGPGRSRGSRFRRPDSLACPAAVADGRTGACGAPWRGTDTGARVLDAAELAEMPGRSEHRLRDRRPPPMEISTRRATSGATSVRGWRAGHSSRRAAKAGSGVRLSDQRQSGRVREILPGRQRPSRRSGTQGVSRGFSRPRSSARASLLGGVALDKEPGSDPQRTFCRLGKLWNIDTHQRLIPGSRRSGRERAKRPSASGSRVASPVANFVPGLVAMRQSENETRPIAARCGTGAVAIVAGAKWTLRAVCSSAASSPNVRLARDLAHGVLHRTGFRSSGRCSAADPID